MDEYNAILQITLIIFVIIFLLIIITNSSKESQGLGIINDMKINSNSLDAN